MKLLLCLAAILAFVWMGNEEYAEALEREAMEKELRVYRAKQAHPAPIYIARCDRKGYVFIAKQSDGGKWQGFCVRPNT